jgi:hypothetical protein
MSFLLCQIRSHDLSYGLNYLSSFTTMIKIIFLIVYAFLNHQLHLEIYCHRCGNQDDQLKEAFLVKISAYKILSLCLAAHQWIFKSLQS